MQGVQIENLNMKTL